MNKNIIAFESNGVENQLTFFYYNNGHEQGAINLMLK